MAQETFTLTLDNVNADVDVVINDTSNIPYVDFIGTYQDLSATWTVPTGVTSINAVTIGGGAGGGAGAYGPGGGGGGGGLSWKNSIAVTPGETLYIQAGRYGQGGAAPSDPPGMVANGGYGGNSLIYRNTGSIVYLLSANGGVYGLGAGTGGQGGNGGATQDSSYGGERGANGSPSTTTSANGFSIRPGGGAGTYNSTTLTSSSGGGDGRSLAGGTGAEDTGVPDSQYPERGETYGGGGSGGRSFGWRGGPGAVRIRIDSNTFPNPG